MGIVILSLYNIHMLDKQEVTTETFLEIPLEQFLEKVTEEEKEPEIKENRKIVAAKKTHDAYNEDFEDPDEKNNFEERLKNLMNTASEGSESKKESLDDDGEVPIISSDDESKNKREDTGTKNDTKPANSVTNNRNSSLSFSLKNRKAIDLPNPVYTCNGSGKVVVRIKVNHNGYVVDTKIDKKNSTTKNECLFDNALNYAEQALFSRSNTTEQKGSITYYFDYTL